MKDLFQRAAVVMTAVLTSQESTFVGMKRSRDANPTLEVSSSLFIHQYDTFRYEWAILVLVVCMNIEPISISTRH